LFAASGPKAATISPAHPRWADNDAWLHRRDAVLAAALRPLWRPDTGAARSAHHLYLFPDQPDALTLQGRVVEQDKGTYVIDEKTDLGWASSGPRCAMGPRFATSTP
jgi:hypothetical protein